MGDPYRESPLDRIVNVHFGDPVVGEVGGTGGLHGNTTFSGTGSPLAPMEVYSGQYQTGHGVSVSDNIVVLPGLHVDMSMHGIAACNIVGGQPLAFSFIVVVKDLLTGANIFDSGEIFCGTASLSWNGSSASILSTGSGLSLQPWLLWNVDPSSTRASGGVGANLDIVARRP